MYMDTPPIPLIKSNCDDNSDKDLVKLKLLRDTTSEKSDLYEFKTDFLDNGDLEEFLLLVRNFNTTFDTSGTLATDAKVQYLRTLVRV